MKLVLKDDENAAKSLCNNRIRVGIVLRQVILPRVTLFVQPSDVVSTQALNIYSLSSVEASCVLLLRILQLVTWCQK